MIEKLNGLGPSVVESIFSNELGLFCVEHGIIHERTPPYSPQSNGMAERKNRTLTDLVNAMLDTLVSPRHDGGRRY